MHSEADSDGEHRARKWTERRKKSPVTWEMNHEIRNRGNRRGTRHERVELERGIILIKMKQLRKDKIKNSMLQCPLL